MRDITDKLLAIDDTVVYLKGKNSNASLAIGKIKKFYRNRYGEQECTVASHTHISSSRILKLDSTEN